MNHSFKFSVFVILLIEITIYFTSCKKETIGINNATTIPGLTTTVVTSITSTTAVSGGNITADGSGIITERGLCYSTHQLPTIGDYVITNGVGSRDFTINLTWLTPNTTYYVRAYATNDSGVAYGDEVSFITSPIGSIIFNPYLNYGSVSDIDGNIYKTIQIGSQHWMAENLKTTKYNDGTSIQNVTDFIEWSGLTTGAYCWYDNNASVYKVTYGALYNWFTVNTGKLCPTGWHVPTNAEWTTLVSNLGGNDVAGGKLKETGTTHWQNPNTGATNAYGFTALPGGTRNLFSDPDFNDWSWITQEGNWWSASSSAYSAIYWGVFYDNNRIDSQSLLFKQSGFSVRCVKDN